MAIVTLDITSRTPYADGAAFGAAGAYERIDAVLTYAVDPAHEANRAIVDIGVAPRDADGRVRFIGDLTLLVPQTPSRGNGRLFVDVVNRGRRTLVPTFNLAVPSRTGSAEVPVGDGFLFRHGYSVASIGWQWDVYRSDMMMGIEPPVIPVRGQVLVEIRPDRVQTTRTLANRVHKPYATVDVEDPEARLLVKDWEDGPYTEVPRGQWRFAQDTPDGVQPSAEHVYMEHGFQPGKIYHVIFTAEGSPIVGAGLLALRDAASWLKHALADTPVADGFERVYAYGVSQTGRLLRHFLYLGLNADEQGRQVYDGLIPHVAGGRRGEFNQRFGQPSAQSVPGFGHLFPFADDALKDPYSGQTAGLLDKPRAQGNAPRILYTNTSAEYWRGDGSLVHIAPEGDRDLPLTAESRAYLFAGTQHADARQLPAPGDPAIDGTLGRYQPNVVDYRPLLRAALVNLDRWVSEGVEPPASAHPRLKDATAVTRAEALAQFPAIPGLIKPDPERLWVLRESDMGPEADKGIASLPIEEGRAYPSHVSAVDADGNEVAGIRLPELTEPVGAYTGWNPRHPDSGAPEQIIPMVGSTHFLPADRQTRQATGDPRPSIAERYANRDAYEAAARAQAEALVTQRYLLSEDVDVAVANALRHYDEALGQ